MRKRNMEKQRAYWRAWYYRNKEKHIQQVRDWQKKKKIKKYEK